MQTLTNPWHRALLPMLLACCLPAQAQAQAQAKEQRSILVYSNATAAWSFRGGQGTDIGFVRDNDNLRIVSNPGKAWWSMTYEVDLPADATDIALRVRYFEADDRGELFINGGSTGAAVGIGGPGKGAFRFNPGDQDVPLDFGANGEQELTLTKGFLAGRTNLITLAVNNTNAGIGGATAAPGPSQLAFASFLFYSTNAPIPEVPEPATWLMLGAGLACWQARRAKQPRQA